MGFRPPFTRPMLTYPSRFVPVHVILCVVPAVQVSPPFGLMSVKVDGPPTEPVIAIGPSPASDAYRPQASSPLTSIV